MVDSGGQTDAQDRAIQELNAPLSVIHCITNHCTSNPWCCIASSRHRRDTTGLSIQAAADSSHSPVCKETELQTHKVPSHEIYFMGPDVLNKTFFPELIKHLLPCPVKLLTSATKSSGKGSGLNWI